MMVTCKTLNIFATRECSDITEVLQIVLVYSCQRPVSTTAALRCDSERYVAMSRYICSAFTIVHCRSAAVVEMPLCAI